MRMNGSWHIYRPGERWHRPRHQARVVIETEAFVAVAFNVPVAGFCAARELAREPTLRDLGPDLLGDSFDEDAAVARLRARGPLGIGDALLDQRASRESATSTSRRSVSSAAQPVHAGRPPLG